MSFISFTDEITSPLAAGKLFNAFYLDFHNLSPKVLPQFIKNVELIGGDGGPGSIKKFNFAQGDEWKQSKHKIDAMDKEKLTYNYTLIEVESIMENLQSISYETKFEASPGGGSKAITVTKYYPKPGAQINEQKVKEHKEKITEKAMEMHKVMEGYLLANPTVCA